MKILARRATDAASSLPDELRHRVILTAMAGYYLSSPGASTPYARTIADNVAAAIGPLLPRALALFRVRRAFTRLAGGGQW